MSSVHTVPLLFINLGGEMLYILDQRLTAQKICKTKAIKVMNDIVGIMFNERFVKELFKPQEVYNKHALRKLFEDLAHASIMRLNKASMDKLYDLMTMTFKYQLVMSAQPLDVLFITLNHLDTIRRFVPVPHLQKQIDVVYEMLIEVRYLDACLSFTAPFSALLALENAKSPITYVKPAPKYGNLTSGELQNIRYCLLNFFQDLKVRVSVFLKQGVQQDDGKFVIPLSGTVAPGFEVPGLIRIYGWNGQLIQERQFERKGSYSSQSAIGSLDKYGYRGTTLGCNMYKDHPDNTGSAHECESVEASETDFPLTPDVEAESEAAATAAAAAAFAETAASGREELNLLMTQLLGQRGSGSHGQTVSRHHAPFHLHLFTQDMDEEDLNQQMKPKDTVNIDAYNHPKSAVLDKIYGELTIEEPQTDDTPQDIVDLIDNLL